MVLSSYRVPWKLCYTGSKGEKDNVSVGREKMKMTMTEEGEMVELKKE